MIGKFLEKKSGRIMIDMEQPYPYKQYWISMGHVKAFSIYKPTAW